MSEEIKKAYKLFNREDLIDDGYERDLDSNIQVFLTTKQMINYMNLQQKVEHLQKENKRLNNIINECANDILKELKENNHLSYGVALSIRNKLLDYKELKENK